MMLFIEVPSASSLSKSQPAISSPTAWLECGNSSTKLSFTGSCSSGQAYARYVNITVTRPFTPLFGTRYFPGANSDGTYTINGEAGIRIQ